MRSTTHWSATIAGVTMLSLALAGCGSPGPTSDSNATGTEGLVIDGVEIADASSWAAAQDEGKIILYTSQSQNRIDALAAIFTEQTGLPMEIVHLGGGKLNERIRAEAAAGKIEADVITQSDLTLALDDIDAGAFAQYCPPGVEEAVDPLFILEDCSAMGLSIVGLGIAYNNAILSEGEAPTSWTDIIDGVEGGVALQSISTGGSTWSVYLYLLEEYGIESWEALAAADPLITDAASSSQEAVVAGERSVAAIAATGNVMLAVEQGAPLTLVFPEDGAVGYITWTGLAATAQHPNAAKVYLNWLASPAGQQATADTGDFHSWPGAPTPVIEGVEVPTFDELVITEVWPEYVSKREAAIKDWATIFNYTN